MSTPNKPSEGREGVDSQVESQNQAPNPEAARAALEAAQAAREGEVHGDAAAQTDELRAELDLEEGTADVDSDEDERSADAGEEDEEPTSGWAGLFSGISSAVSSLKDWLEEKGGGVSKWLADLFGFKKDGTEEGADPDEDEDRDFDLEVPIVPEKSIEEHEMLTPDAPVFTFTKTLGQDPSVSDVPRIRLVHPVTKEKNVPHEGVDVPAPVGTPLYATQEMTFENTTNNGASGLRVNARLKDGTRVSFLHMSKAPSYKKGDVIPRGAWLGNTGNSGRSSGPHLHFEINDGESGDPIEYLDPGLIASAERKIQSKKDKGEWKPLEGVGHEHA